MPSTAAMKSVANIVRTSWLKEERAAFEISVIFTFEEPSSWAVTLRMSKDTSSLMEPSETTTPEGGIEDGLAA
jgi:hypothetical protein